MPDVTATPAQPGTVVDPYRAYNFKLVVQGLVQGHFTRVDGMAIKVGRLLYREGGERATVRSIPGPVEYATVTLMYGLTSDRTLVDWLFTAVNGAVERRNVSLAMLDDTGSSEVQRWNLVRAWPCEWRGAPLDAMGSEMAIEQLSLAYDRLELDGGPTSA